MPNDPEDTVRLPRAPPPPHRLRRSAWLLIASSLAAIGGVGVGWWVWSPPPATPLAEKLAPVQATLPPAPPLLGEAAILMRSTGLTEVYRFSHQTEIVVVDFASYAEQADALNRIAALTERTGFSRDRVIAVYELNARIVAAGGSPQTFYYGHDYRAGDLVRFFELLDQSGEPPTAGEAILHRWLQAWEWDARTNAALISLVQTSDIATILSPAERATILRHELSHGLYFTSPAYSRYARDFFAHTLAESERAQFRKFLAAEGYDTAIDDLVVNETQAYLMHTAEPAFFSASAVGIVQARIDVLRGLFLTGMPSGWLRDCTGLPPQ